MTGHLSLLLWSGTVLAPRMRHGDAHWFEICPPWDSWRATGWSLMPPFWTSPMSIWCKSGQSRVTLWRRSAEARVRHRLPSLRTDLGIGLQTICIDSLHALYMGPAHDSVPATFWAVIRANAYGAAGGAVKNTMPITVMRLRNDLWAFYKQMRTLFPGEDVTQIEDLTPKMFGEPGREKFGPVKASEIKHVLS